jgi:hypothetical protein
MTHTVDEIYRSLQKKGALSYQESYEFTRTNILQIIKHSNFPESIFSVDTKKHTITFVIRFLKQYKWWQFLKKNRQTRDVDDLKRALYNWIHAGVDFSFKTIYKEY